jgi:hypothetical protein
MSSISFVGDNSSTANATAYTFSSEPIGVADSGRVVIVGVAGRAAGTSGFSLSSLTVGGISASNITTAHGNTDGNSNCVALAAVEVPSGTTEDIVATFNREAVRSAIQVYRAVDITTAPNDTRIVESSDPATTILDVPIGFAIGVAASASSTSAAWSGLTEDYEENVESFALFTSASDEFLTADPSLTADVNFTANGTDTIGLFASWAYAASNAVFPLELLTQRPNALLRM